MRHERLQSTEACDVVDLAQLEPERAADIEGSERATTAVPDMPAAAGVFIVAAYVGLMAAFAVTLGHDGKTGFVLLIAGFFVAMFFGIPLTFLRTEKDSSRRPSLMVFLENGIDTATGRISGSGALVQMLIVPLLLVLAILAIGLINLII